ncbi:MAG: tetratricopeptide repeat protein [Anaeromyxobacter sp.]
MSGTGESVLERLLRYLELDPGNWNLRADVFDAALAAGRFELAEHHAEAALREKPTDGAWVNRRANLLLATSRFAEAQLALEALLSAGQDNPVVRYNLAYALFGQGKYAEAAALAAPLRAALPIAWVLWLRCQHQLDQLDVLLPEFRAAIPGGALPAEAFGVASLAAADAGALSEAAAWADRGLAGRADLLEALAARGTVSLAATDAEGALGWFGRALDANPNDGRSWSGLAMGRMLKADLQGATEAFLKAIVTMPRHIGTWIGLGWCRFFLQDLPGAREAFESALRLDHNFGESHGALAVVLAKEGRMEEARREIELARRLDPNGASAQYAMAVVAGRAEDPDAVRRLAGQILRRQQAAIAAGDAAAPGHPVH